MKIKDGGHTTNRSGEHVGPVYIVACQKRVDKEGFYYVSGMDSWYSNGRKNLDEESPLDLMVSGV